MNIKILKTLLSVIFEGIRALYNDKKEYYGKICNYNMLKEYLRGCFLWEEHIYMSIIYMMTLYPFLKLFFKLIFFSIWFLVQLYFFLIDALFTVLFMYMSFFYFFTDENFYWKLHKILTFFNNIFSFKFFFFLYNKMLVMQEKNSVLLFKGDTPPIYISIFLFFFSRFVNFFGFFLKKKFIFKYSSFKLNTRKYLVYFYGDCVLFIMELVIDFCLYMLSFSYSMYLLYIVSWNYYYILYLLGSMKKKPILNEFYFIYLLDHPMKLISFYFAVSKTSTYKKRIFDFYTFFVMSFINKSKYLLYKRAVWFFGTLYYLFLFSLWACYFSFLFIFWVIYLFGSLMWYMLYNMYIFFLALKNKIKF